MPRSGRRGTTRYISQRMLALTLGYTTYRVKLGTHPVLFALSIIALSIIALSGQHGEAVPLKLPLLILGIEGLCIFDSLIPKNRDVSLVNSGCVPS